ncbi:hypothetical protein LMG27952_07157 [Paraburkholderia hiiakae]|uniref:Uncharacterized protein n=1 Tax=Paraburkholderia hiiakae TaxID=1081782 RepID=A0ABM8PA81_9BURK|nr:hypothetical protein LMG27952_07157 [Paraburkholderia hiiakae]
MKRIIFFGGLLMLASNLGCAAPPDENMVKSCLQAQFVTSSITINILNTNEITQEDDYADGSMQATCLNIVEVIQATLKENLIRH